MINLFLNDLFCKIGKYQDAKDLWSKLAKLYESPSLEQYEDELEKEESLAQEPKHLKIERYLISEMEEDKETFTSKIEGEDKSSTMGQDELLISGANEEEVCATPTIEEDML